MTARWRGHAHPELYTMIHVGPGAGASDAQTQYWRSLTEDLEQVDADLNKALGDVRATWEGSASDSAQTGMTPLQEWATDARTGSSVMRLSTEDQAEYISTARAEMPPPVAVTTPEPSTWQKITAGASVLTGDAGPAAEVARQSADHELQEAASSAAAQKAVDTMNTYESSSTWNANTLGTFQPPPSVVISTPPPSGATSAGVAGGWANGLPGSSSRNTGTTASSFSVPSGSGGGGGGGGTRPPTTGGGGTSLPSGAGGGGGGGTTTLPPAPGRSGTTPSGGGGPVGTTPGRVPTLPGGGTGGPGKKPGDPGGSEPPIGGLPGGTPPFTVGGGGGELSQGNRPGATPGGARPGVPGLPGGGQGGLGVGGFDADGSKASSQLGRGGATGLGMSGGEGPLGRGGPGGAAGAGGRGGFGGGGPMGAGAGHGDDDDEHFSPDYLMETTDVFGDERVVSPAVIGESQNPEEK